MENAKTIISKLEDSVKLAESENRQTIPLVAIKSIVTVFRKDELADLEKMIAWSQQDTEEAEIELQNFKVKYAEYFKKEVK